MVALFVVITFVVFLFISALLQKKEVKDTAEDFAISPNREVLPFPKGYFFSPNHTWLSLESSGNITIGIDELVQRFLGKISSVQLKNSGDYVMKGEELAVFKKGDKKISITSPVSGKIEYTNFEIDQNPERLTNEPYQECWVCSLKPTHFSDDIKSLKIAEEAKSWLSNEFSRLKDFVFANQLQPALSTATLSDGGTLVDGIADYLDGKAIGEFEKQFLMNLNEEF